MSDQSLATSQTTNQSTSRREYRRRQPAIDGQPTDPILGQYSYSTADDEYRCLLCPYRNRRQRSIRDHMVSHSDCRPYQCPDCTATFKRQSVLRHHRNRHQLLKPYVCPHDGCHKTYTQPQSLRAHIAGQHSPLRYRCLLDGCGRDGRPFACLKHLRAHQRRRHYRRLAIAGGQHPVLPFNEWINSLADNYDTAVVDGGGDTEGLSAESLAPLEVSDNMVANAVSDGLSAPSQTPSSPSPSSLLSPISDQTSDQSLLTAETTNQNIPRRRGIDVQPTDPILEQYSYSAADDEYRCLLCPYRNRRPQCIHKHMIIHSDRRPYRCGDCTAAFKRQRDLRRHHRVRHQLLKPYVCPHDGCHKRYPRLQVLKDHIDGQHSPLSYRCLLEGCGRDRRPFACLKHLRAHQRSRHYRRLAIAGGQHPVLPFNEWINSLFYNYETFVIDGGGETEGLSAESLAPLEVSDEMAIFPICELRELNSPATDPSLKSITDHMSDQSLPTAETTNQSTPRRQYRRRHAIDRQPTDPILGQYSYSAADGEYRCLLCPYRNRHRRPNNIRQHMVTHSNRRPYKCPLCPMTFKRQNPLRIHHRSRHQLLKSCVCPHEGCHKRFAQSGSLKEHIDGQHSPLRYRCLLTDCDRRAPFTCLRQLRRHQRHCHYRPLLTITGGQHPVLPFNEWINTLINNYETLVVDGGDETEGLSAESLAALEVSDEMVDNAINTGQLSPPVLPIHKAWESLEALEVSNDMVANAVSNDELSSPPQPPPLPSPIVVGTQETKDLSTESSAAELDVSDDMVVNADNTERHAPQLPPFLPIRKAPEVVATDAGRACDGVDTDHNDLSGELPTELFNKISLPTDPEVLSELSISEQFLGSAETTNQSIPRRECRRRKPVIDGQPKDPILRQYLYSTADDEYRCLLCPYRNRKPLYIRQHMVRHTDRLLYQCPDCTAAFKRSEHLKRHHRSGHQLLKPYVCPHDGCDKRYTQRESLKAHIDGQHLPLSYRCLLEGCGRDRRPFTCLRQLRKHQRRCHYRPLLAIIGGQHPVLPFNEWINSFADNYDTVVVDVAEGLATDSSAKALEVSDDMVANADNTGRHAPPPLSPPILPICKAREVVATDSIRPSDGVDADHNELSGQLSTTLFNNTSLAADPQIFSMSDQFLTSAETMNQSISRRECRKRQPVIDGQPTDPVLGLYSYSIPDDEYICLRCPYRNRNEQNLRQHMVRHTDGRPYQCPDCSAAYKWHNGLKRHHRSRHQLLKPYVCPHDGCHKRFTAGHSLKYHIRAQHSSLRYRCLLDGCGRRDQPFTCQKNLRTHQRRRHYNPLAVNGGGQHPVLPFKEWFNSLIDNYDMVVVDADSETEVMSTESLGVTLEVSDDIADAVSNRVSPPPPSPPVLPVCERRQSVPTDERSACNGVDTDHNHISGQLSKRRRRDQRVDETNSLGPSQTPQFVYECNFDSCVYTSGVFEEIADHFVVHWDHYNRDLGHKSTDDRD